MAAGSIIVDLLLKTGSFESDTARAQKALKKLRQEADDLGKKAGLAFVAATAGLTYLVKSSIDAQDHLNDLSKKTGIAADTLGGIGFAAQQSGGDIESVSLAAGKLNKSLAEAAAGNDKAAEAFKLLGIKVTDATGATKKADVAMAELADKFAGFEDGPEKVALALRIFGKAGADIIPLLDEGGKSLRDNIDYFKRYSGVTNETAAQADQFNDTLAKLNLLSGAFAKHLVADLLPALQGLADLWLENKEKGDQFQGTASGIAETVKALALFVGYGAESFVIYGKSIGAVAAAAGALAGGSLSEARDVFKALAEDGEAARARIEGLRKVLGAPTKPFDPFGKIDFGKGDGWDPKKKAPRLGADNPDAAGKDDFNHLYKQALGLKAVAQAALDAGEDFQLLTDAQKLGAKVALEYASGVLKLTPAQLMTLDATLKVASAVEKEAAAQERHIKWMQAATDANATFIESQQHARDTYLEQAKAAKIELDAFGLTREEVDKLATSRMRETAAALEQKAAVADADGFLSDVADLYREQARLIRETANARDFLSQKEHDLHYDSLTGATQAVKDYLDSINRAGDESYQLVKTAFQSLEDAAVSAFTTGNIKDAAKQMVSQILAEIYRLAVVRPLLNSIFGSGGFQGLGGLAQLFSGRGAVDGAGGIANAEGAYPVGLATGTNLVPYDGFKATLHKGEAVVPKEYNPAAGGSKAGGGNVYITNNAGARVSAQRDENGDFQVLVEQAASAAHDKVNRSIVTGGSTHRALAGTYGVSRATGAPKRA